MTDDRRHIYDGNELALYFLSGEYPERMAGHPLSETIYDTVRELRGSLVADRPVFLHMDFWPGNILWVDGRISAVVDWDASGYGDPAIDVGYFRMDAYLRGIKEAAQPLLEYYEASSGPVRNLGYWEVARAAAPLPDPAAWIPEAGDLGRPRGACRDERTQTTTSLCMTLDGGRMRGGEEFSLGNINISRRVELSDAFP